MASRATTHDSFVVRLFFIFSIHLLSINVFSFLKFTGWSYKPGLELPIVQTDHTRPFQRQSPCVYHNRSPCRSPAFSSLHPGILRDLRLITTSKLFWGFLGCFWKGRRVTWGDEANEKQWPHSAAGANCWEGGRRWQKLQLTDPVSYCCLRHPRALIKVLYHLSHTVKSTRPRTVLILVLHYLHYGRISQELFREVP